MCFSCRKSNQMKSVCVTCRTVNGSCHHEKLVVNYRWRPPKKTNNKAWKKIADGDIWWDKRAVAGKETASRLRHANYVLYWTRERVAERQEKRRIIREAELERLRSLHG